MDPIVLLKELVAIDSVNPSLVEGAAGEGAVARRLAEVMGAAGMTVTLEEIGAGSPQRHRRRRGTRAGSNADVLRSHRHRRRRAA